MRTEAQTYYVQEAENGWFAYFTVNEAFNLLQVYSDFGSYAYRWGEPGPDFKAFLIQTNNAGHKLEGMERVHRCTDTQRAERRLESQVNSLMTHLWPLFIELLKAEREEAVAGD